MKEEQIIFIVSQPRSGSTYLQNLLSNNNDINTCSEPWILLNFANQIKPDLITGTFDNSSAISAFRDYLSKCPDYAYDKYKKDFLLNLYIPLGTGFRFVIDKTPRYWEILHELKEMFPRSRIVILKRNPIDVAISMIKTWNYKSLEELNYFNRDLLLAPKIIQSFCEANKTNKNVFFITYEDLISKTAEKVEALYKWIGIPYSKSVLDTQNNNKFKGNYGDPFQNGDRNIHDIRKALGELKLNPVFESFLKGYKNYLGEEFLHSYGYHAVDPGTTKEFHQFLRLSASRAELKVEIDDMQKCIQKLRMHKNELERQVNFIRSSKDYNVGKFFLSPFRFLKKSLIKLLV